MTDRTTHDHGVMSWLSREVRKVTHMSQNSDPTTGKLVRAGDLPPDTMVELVDPVSASDVAPHVDVVPATSGADMTGAGPAAEQDPSTQVVTTAPVAASDLPADASVVVSDPVAVGVQTDGSGTSTGVDVAAVDDSSTQNAPTPASSAVESTSPTGATDANVVVTSTQVDSGAVTGDPATPTSGDTTVTVVPADPGAPVETVAAPDPTTAPPAPTSEPAQGVDVNDPNATAVDLTQNPPVDVNAGDLAASQAAQPGPTDATGAAVPQELDVDPEATTHVVQPNDTLHSIAMKHGCSITLLYEVNINVIEGEVQKRGFSTSNGGQILPIGAELTIPKIATPASDDVDAPAEGS